ncbi:MAG: mechanosensitive ion channel [Planctomycetes bacterium]|nr:mechanosensitive ion channel [Planctomycetota bacterium]
MATFYGLRAMFVVVLMVLAWTISSWASMLVRTGLRRVKFDETLTTFVSKMVRWLILGLTALTCLSYFGVETTSFAAVIGAAGLAIGLAFQGTLSNFAAGRCCLFFVRTKSATSSTSPAIWAKSSKSSFSPPRSTPSTTAGSSSPTAKFLAR